MPTTIDFSDLFRKPIAWVNAMLGRNAIHDPASIRQKVIHGGAWALTGYALSQIVRLVGNLIMTRLLAPETFGVMSVATTLMVGLGMMSDLGLQPNVIQSSRGKDPAFLNTVWCIQILRGTTIYSISLIAAVALYIAQQFHWIPSNVAYGDPSLPGIVAAVCLVVFIGGFDSTKILEASRNLQLRKIVLIDLSSQLSALLFMLVWAVNYPSVWALVGGALMGAVTRVTLTHLTLDGSDNVIRFERSSFVEILNFAKWIFASSILGFLVNNGDRLLLASLSNSADFGVFAIASLLYLSVETTVTKIIGDVCFPALSQVARQNPERLKNLQYRFLFVVGGLAYCGAGALYASGFKIVSLMFDARYHDAGWMLEILSVGLIAVPYRIHLQSAVALGKPKILAAAVAVRLITLLLGIVLGFYFDGMRGALMGMAASQLTQIPYAMACSVRLGLLDLKRELPAIPLVLVGFATGKIFVSLLNLL